MNAEVLKKQIFDNFNNAQGIYLFKRFGSLIIKEYYYRKNNKKVIIIYDRNRNIATTTVRQFNIEELKDYDTEGIVRIKPIGLKGANEGRISQNNR
ncbi:MAG: hypothetical protein N2999_01430 [Proteobacteria bacterium]|nr:hypothetical protein [Pseudomonadota bacterium]